MMTITEKVAYLKGLADGMKLDESKDETRLIKAMIDALDDIALTVSDLEDGVGELCDQVDELDESLGLLESDYYDEWDEDCGEYIDDDDEFFQVECPTCGDEIYLDDEMLEAGSIECPNCGEALEFDFSEDNTCDCCSEASDEE